MNHLAPDAVFHDGAPVTSDDVKFTFEELLLKYHSRTRASIGDRRLTITTPDAHVALSGSIRQQPGEVLLSR